MFRYEQRDNSGPMDVDNPDPMARLAQFALGPDEGPSRKRMHMDIDTPSRAFPTSSSTNPGGGSMLFGTDTPFIFHSAPRSPSYEPYDPSKWAARNFKFGFSGSGSGEAEDVEMRFGDSPSRPRDSPATGGQEVDNNDNKSEGKSEAENKGGERRRSDARSEVGTGETRKIASGAVTRVRRKRQKEWRRRRGSDTDGEPDDRQVGPSKSEHHYNLHMPTQALQHSEIPKLLLGYLQVFVNISIVVFCIFLVIQFVLTVRRDVNDRMREHSVELLQEIAECTNLYLLNRCDPSMRVPAMEAACRAWELCMNRDPTVIGRIEVVAETFAGSINSFVDAISWKTMGFTLVTLSFLVILTNSALYNLRSRHPTPPPPPPPNQYPHQPYLHNGNGNQPHHYPGQLPNAPHMPIPSQSYGQQQVGAIGWNGGMAEREKKKGWW